MYYGALGEGLVFNQRDSCFTELREKEVRILIWGGVFLPAVCSFLFKRRGEDTFREYVCGRNGGVESWKRVVRI